MAILAGGAIIGLGTTATLAAWTDTEWVFGGNALGNGPGLGTSNFEVEQNVTSPYTEDEFFGQFETNPGQALTFGFDALSLNPGDTVFAQVALRTIAGSGAGDLTLQPAVEPDVSVITTTDPGGDLWAALTLQVWTSTSALNCTSAVEATNSGTLIAGGDITAAPDVSEPGQSLGANSDGAAYYCFGVTLPAMAEGADTDILQGRGVAPAWEFAAVSTD